MFFKSTRHFNNTLAGLSKRSELCCWATQQGIAEADSIKRGCFSTSFFMSMHSALCLKLIPQGILISNVRQKQLIVTNDQAAVLQRLPPFPAYVRVRKINEF